MENKLWYKSEATCFEEALPLGNGSFGAMVYGGTEKEKLSLNLDTLWSGKNHSYKSDTAIPAYKEAQKLTLEGNIQEAEKLMAEKFHNLWSEWYLPLGSLIIERANSSAENYYRQLDLSKAVTAAKFGNTENECFISSPDKVLVFKEKNSEKNDYVFTLSSPLKYIIKIIKGTLILSGRCPSKGGMRLDDSEQLPFKYENNEGITFTCAFKILTDGEIKSKGNYLTLNNASEFTLIMAADSSFISVDEPYSKEHEKICLENIKNAAEKDFETLKAEHIKEHSSLYSKTELSLTKEESKLSTAERLLNPDKLKDKGLIELLWAYGKYLTIASSRKGSQATNLQGIWNEHLFAPWRSNYTVNINTEMNYWPTLMLNLYDCHEPLVSLIKRISVTGKETAENFYGARGFVAHHNVDLWGHTSPVGGFGNLGSNHYASWCLSSGWLCTHLFEHYEYSLDKDFLKNIAYPIMKDACLFYMDVMIKDKGEYILCPSSSPENDYFDDKGKVCCLSKKVTMSQAIIKELFIDTLKAIEILDIDPDFKNELTERIENIHPHVIGSDGRLLEWDKEYIECDVHHRHASHLYGIYPGTQITTEKTPDLAEAVKKVLILKGDAGTGWSLGWKINLWAKLKDGNHALSIAQQQLNLVDTKETNYGGGGGTYMNFMDAHPPFQIDGNFGAAAGITQMFLQSECGKIKILPALPDLFESGEIKGIKAKGNVTVSISWKNKKAEKITLLSPVSQLVTVETDGKTYEVPLTANKERVL